MRSFNTIEEIIAEIERKKKTGMKQPSQSRSSPQGTSASQRQEIHTDSVNNI